MPEEVGRGGGGEGVGRMQAAPWLAALALPPPPLRLSLGHHPPRGVNGIGEKNSQNELGSGRPLTPSDRPQPVVWCTQPDDVTNDVHPDMMAQTTLAGEPRTSCFRLKKVANAMYKVFRSHLGLVIILIGYSFAGAGIFQAIESKPEGEAKNAIKEARQSLLNSTWINITELFHEGFLNGTNITDEHEAKLYHFNLQLEIYERALQQAFLHGVGPEDSLPKWDFWGAFLFCATVYTTIGYGHIAPSTPAGRVATMLYAIIGIPLCLVVMADLGKLFTKILKFFWSFLRRFYYTGSCRKIRRTATFLNMRKSIERSLERVNHPQDRGHHSAHTSHAHDDVTVGDVILVTHDGIVDAGDSTVALGGDEDDALENHDVEVGDDKMSTYEIDDNFNLPPLVAITIAMVYICVGAVMYTQWEEWDYLEAFYFIFISISTVGFGDILPAHPRYFLASSIYILIGLSLVAMVITVIMEVVNSTIVRAKEAIGTAKDTVVDVGQKIGKGISMENLDLAHVIARRKGSLFPNIREEDSDHHHKHHHETHPERDATTATTGEYHKEPT